jgi:sugar phosphate isomerase/epimerase
MTSPEGAGGRRGLTRKDFLVALPLGVLATGFALRGRGGSAKGEEVSGASPGGAQVPAIGVQLYTLRSVMAEDLEGTLESVAAIGYTEVEFAGLWGRSATDMRDLLAGLGLRAASSHHGLNEVRGDWEATLEAAATLGQKWVVVPSINRDEQTLEGLMAVADDFNAAGEAAQAMGLGFGYHNHAWEFESLSDGTTPYDLLLERCDPSLVSMQMDIFWAVHAGADPLQYFGAYPGRFTSVHVKDRTADGEMVAVGTGVIDFETIMARADQAGIEHYFVEHDNPVDPLEDVRISFATLHGILS